MKAQGLTVFGVVLGGLGCALLAFRPASLTVPWRMLRLPATLAPSNSVLGTFTAETSASHEVVLLVPRSCRALSVSDGVRYPDPLPLTTVAAVSRGGEAEATANYTSLRVGGHTTGEQSLLVFPLTTFEATRGSEYKVSVSFSSGTPVGCKAWLEVNLEGLFRENLSFSNAAYTLLAFLPLAGSLVVLIIAATKRFRGARAGAV